MTSSSNVSSAIEVTVPGASVHLRREPWDCTQLGIEAGKLERLNARDVPSAASVLEAAVAQARFQGLRHLAVRIPSSDRGTCLALQRANFVLVDTVVHLALRLSRALPEPRVPQGFGIRWATTEDTDDLGDLSAAAFSDPSSSFNRYLNDPGFTTAQVRQVYSTWAATSVAGAAADSTLVATSGPALVGFLTLRHADTSGIARVPLNAVAQPYRGHGLYRCLVSMAAEEMRRSGADQLEVTTQLQQIAVQRTWYSLGGYPLGSSLSFHRWVDP